MIIASTYLRSSQWNGLSTRHTLATMKDGELVQAALNATGMTQSEMARRLAAADIPMSPDKLNKTIAGTRRLKVPEADAIRKMLDAAEIGESEGNSRSAAKVQVPEYDVRASAGPGAIADEENIRDRWSFSRDYLASIGVLGHELGVIEVIGDSMSETLHSGDRILVDMSDRNPARPGVFVVWDSDATVVKRLEKIPASDPAILVLISDNKNHRTYEVPAELVNVVGRVVWFARRL